LPRQKRKLADNGTAAGDHGDAGAAPEALGEGNDAAGMEPETDAYHGTAGQTPATDPEHAAAEETPNPDRDEEPSGRNRDGEPELAGRTPAAGAEEASAEGESAAAGTAEQAGGTALSDAELNRLIEELCESKAEELRLLGYEEVGGEDVWACVSEGYRKSGMPPLYRVVNDILSLKPGRFMNYITLSMYRGESL